MWNVSMSPKISRVNAGRKELDQFFANWKRLSRVCFYKESFFFFCMIRVKFQLCRNIVQNFLGESSSSCCYQDFINTIDYFV